MIKLTSSVTTPQVFFNTEYIGGCQKIKDILGRYKQEAKFSGYSTIKQRIRIEVLDVQMQHVNLLRLSPTQPSDGSMDMIRKTSEQWRHYMESYDKLMLLNSEQSNITQVTRELKSWLRNSSVIGTAEKRFLGSGVKAFLMRKYGFDGLQSSTFGEKLVALGVIHNMSECMATNRFSEKASYSLQQDQCPNIINGFRIWSKKLNIENFSPDPTPFLTVSNLMKSLSAILVSATSSQGDIDYGRARMSSGYERFLEEVAYLQLINLGMNDNSKKALFLNIYNLLASHLFVEFNPKRMTSDLFCDFYYNVGGYLLSLDDIYHGILRGNAKHPLTGKRVFGKKDERKQLAVLKVDPRIHFALNNSTGGCVPGYEFHRGSLKQELHVVARKNCTMDQSIVVDDVCDKLTLPYFFKTYLNDFVKGKGAPGLPEVLLNYLEGEKREQMDRMIRIGKRAKRRVRIHFKKMDENSRNDGISQNGQKCVHRCALFPWRYFSKKQQKKNYSKMGTPSQPTRVDQKSPDNQRLLKYESSYRQYSFVEGSNISNISNYKFSERGKSFKTFERGISRRDSSTDFFKIDTHIISDSGGEWADFSSIEDFPRTPTKVKIMEKIKTPLTSTETPDTQNSKIGVKSLDEKVDNSKIKNGSDNDSDEVSKPEISKPPDSRRLDFEIELMDELFPTSVDGSLKGKELFPEDADYSQFEGSLAESDLNSNNGTCSTLHVGRNDYIGKERADMVYDDAYFVQKSTPIHRKSFSEASF